jgi:hypothetical protein
LGEHLGEPLKLWSSVDACSAAVLSQAGGG